MFNTPYRSLLPNVHIYSTCAHLELAEPVSQMRFMSSWSLLESDLSYEMSTILLEKRPLCSYSAITNLLSLRNTLDIIPLRKQIILVSSAYIELTPKLRLHKKEFSFIISMQR